MGPDNISIEEVHLLFRLKLSNFFYWRFERDAVEITTGASTFL